MSQSDDAARIGRARASLSVRGMVFYFGLFVNMELSLVAPMRYSVN